MVDPVLRHLSLAKFQSEMYHPNVEVTYQGMNPKKPVVTVDGRKRETFRTVRYIVYLYWFVVANNMGVSLIMVVTPKTGPQNDPFFSKKTHGCWGNLTVLGNPQMVVYPHQKKASSISRESTNS